MERFFIKNDDELADLVARYKIDDLADCGVNSCFPEWLHYYATSYAACKNCEDYEVCEDCEDCEVYEVYLLDLECKKELDKKLEGVRQLWREEYDGVANIEDVINIREVGHDKIVVEYIGEDVLVYQNTGGSWGCTAVLV